jgi:hypothetical protein
VISQPVFAGFYLCIFKRCQVCVSGLVNNAAPRDTLKGHPFAVTPFEHIRNRVEELTFAAFRRLAGPQAFENQSLYAQTLFHLLQMFSSSNRFPMCSLAFNGLLWPFATAIVWIPIVAPLYRQSYPL